MTAFVNSRMVGAVAVSLSICACMPRGAKELNQGSALYAAGDYRGAANAYREAIAADPAWTAPYLGLGNSLRALGDNGAAIIAYRRATEMDNNSVEAYTALGLAFADEAMWDEAAVALRRASDLGAPEPIAIRLAVALTETARFSEAVTLFSHARRRCPSCFNDEAEKAFTKATSELERGAIIKVREQS